MTTTLNTIYPPQVDTFMPSFCYNESAKIWFNISSYDEDEINLIKYIHVSMVDQRNNENVFAGTSNGTTVYPQYYPIAFNNDNNKIGYDSNKGMYWLVIPPQILKTSPYYNTNQYYKIQLRFDLTGSPGFEAPNNNYDNPTNFFKIENNNITANALGLALYTSANQDNFSEWSTGTLIKPIFIPNLDSSIKNFSTDSESPTEVSPNTDIRIFGNISFSKADGDEIERIINEKLSWYQIKILDLEEINSFFDSDKIYPNSNNEINYIVDMSKLTINSEYKMQIICGIDYEYSQTKTYFIKIKDYDDYQTKIDYTPIFNEENGTISLQMKKSSESIDDNYYAENFIVIRRSSYHSNFTNWDLIFSDYARNLLNDDGFIFIDDTIESMVGYRYQLQIVTNQEPAIIYEPIRTDILHCDFYGGILSDKNKKLSINFNFQPSNRANAVNRTKIDTLGGQYPIFTQNSKLKYHTYNITGRISTEDNGELFLSKQELFGDDFYNYRYEYTSTGNEDVHNNECQTVRPNADWLYEREYRDAVEEWLNNGKPKLFRSMTEGNMIVILDGITLTPDPVLGRRLYDFNATMYEIGDGKDIESMVTLGVFNMINKRQ